MIENGQQGGLTTSDPPCPIATLGKSRWALLFCARPTTAVDGQSIVYRKSSLLNDGCLETGSGG